jgi:hypothetical protein
MNVWTYKGELVQDDIWKGYEGFIYEITYECGTKYIGRKSFFTTTTKPEPKSQKTIGKYLSEGYEKVGYNKNRKRHYKYVKKIESNWREYTGSSKLTKDMKVVSKEILVICEKLVDMTYWEMYYLFAKDVIFNDKYINQSAGKGFYAGQVTGSKKYIKEYNNG